LGRYAESVEAFGQVIRLVPRLPTAYRFRAINQLYLGRGEETAKDVREWLKLTNWDRNDVHFMIIFGVLGYRMAGQADAAESLLAEAVKRADAAAWPYPVLRYLKREIPAAAVLELANTNDRLTEAHAYIGMDLSLDGKRAEALEHLRWVKEHGNRNFIEYPLALAEITRLEKAAANPPRQ
jgi:lipoprotein NlpI